MKNTLADLNNHLFEQLERINDEDLTEEQMQKEITRSVAVTKVAETIIKNGELALKTMQHLDNYGYNKDKAVPQMLENKSCDTVKK